MSSVSIVVPGSRALIQEASWRDLNAVRQLEQVCFPRDAWPLLDIIGVLTFSSVLRLKAVVERQMVGFLAADVRKGERLAWIATVGVLPAFRRRGIGEALLKACEQTLELPRVRLNVRTSNAGAIRLYKRLGYAQVGTWPRYYQDGEEAMIFEKKLGG